MKKTLKFLACAAVAVALAFTTSCNGKEDPIDVVDPWEGLEAPPTLANPGAGKVTIAMHAPTGPICNGIGTVGRNILVGEDRKDWAMGDVAENKWTKVEGKERWWTITLDLPADNSGDKSMRVRAILLDEQGNGAWGSRWSNNSYVVQGTGTFVQNGGDKDLDNLTGGVVFVANPGWEANPCIPLAMGSFEVTVSNLPEGAQVGIKGDFPERDWGASGAEPYEMTFSNGKWRIANVPVREGTPYIYMWSMDGETWREESKDRALNPSWPGDQNRQVNANFTQVDVVTAWVMPPVTDPGWEDLELIGSAFGNWGDDGPSNPGHPFVRGAKEGTTYTWTIASVEIPTASFKVRTLGNWDNTNLGFGDITIAGNDVANFSSDWGNILPAEARTYAIKVVLDYSKIDKTRWTVTFTK
jgi:hypothetical protein